MSVSVPRRLLDFLRDHPFRCGICDTRRPGHQRQAYPGVVWAQVMAAPDPWSGTEVRERLLVDR